jgi:membrane protein implicated in regulation of membrane protease activity
VSRQAVTVAVDAGIAVLLAVLVLIVSPGVAVTGMTALFVVIVCAVSFAIERWLGRRRRRPQRVRTVKKSRRV